MDTAEDVKELINIGMAVKRLNTARVELKSVQSWLADYIESLKRVSGAAETAGYLPDNEVRGRSMLDFSKIPTPMDCQSKVLLALSLSDEIVGLRNELGISTE